MYCVGRIQEIRKQQRSRLSIHDRKKKTNKGILGKQNTGGNKTDSN